MMISTIRQSARDIYKAAGATMRNVWMGETEDAIRLSYGDVIQNDSAVCGREGECYEKHGTPWDPYDALGEAIVLRKTLMVADPCTNEAYVGFVGRERCGHDATLRILVNGNETLRPPSPIATPKAAQYWKLAKKGEWNWSRWYYVKIPRAHIRPGENVIEFGAVDGAEGWRIMVGQYASFHKAALDGDTPAHASAKSIDSGATWHSDHLGPDNDFAGEYVVRLLMRRYRASGWMISDVIDAAGQGDCAIKTPAHVRSVACAVDADIPGSTGIAMSMRWSDTPTHEPDSWTAWKPFTPGRGPVAARGRYLQWRAELATNDRAVTPALRSVTLRCDHEEPPASDDLRVIEFDNAEIQRSSFRFTSECYRHPKLQQLRELCDQDKVVAGAENDWDVIRRLMRWAYLLPLGKCTICPWDALEWLAIKRDQAGDIIVNKYDGRRRDKMCLYSNVLLTELLLACGISARHVNIHSEGVSGHEVCEAWSNVHRKWVHLDATRDFYWIDKAGGEPVSVLEIHNELVRHLDNVETWEDPQRLRLGNKTLADMRIAAQEGDEWPAMDDNGDHLYQTTAHFRIIPRNDYYSRPFPLPVSQGVEVWCWDGYLNWADDMVPRLMHFSHHTNRPQDMYWTNNQTRMTLVRAGPRALEVRLEHDMPNFARYEQSLNCGAWQTVESAFTVDINPGCTELAVRAVNTLGLPGIVSRVVVELSV